MLNLIYKYSERDLLNNAYPELDYKSSSDMINKDGSIRSYLGNHYNEVYITQDIRNKRDWAIKNSKRESRFKSMMLFQADKPRDGIADNYYLRTHTYNRKAKRYDPLFDSWLDACESMFWQKQAMAGLTHSRRDVVVIDIDETWSESYEAELTSILEKATGFKPNITVINPETKHFQLQYLLDEPFICFEWQRGNEDVETYIAITHYLNGLAGDPNFTGGLVKNPMCSWLDTTIHSKTPISKSKLIKNLKPYITFKERKIKKKREKVSKEDYSNLIATFTEDENKIRKRLEDVYGITDKLISFYLKPNKESRNVMAFQSTGSLYMHMKGHPIKKPIDLDGCRLIFTLYEIISLRYNHKPSIETVAEIEASVNGIYNGANFAFDENKKKKAPYTDEEQELGRQTQIIRKYNRLFQIWNLKQQGYTRKEISAKLGISFHASIFKDASTLNRYKIISEVMNHIRLLMASYKGAKKAKRCKVIQQIKQYLSIFRYAKNLTDITSYYGFINEVRSWIQNPEVMNYMKGYLELYNTLLSAVPYSAFYINNNRTPYQPRADTIWSIWRSTA